MEKHIKIYSSISCEQLSICPICGSICEVDEISGYQAAVPVQGQCQIFMCYNPLVTDPLHYYTHTVEKHDQNKLIYREFSLDLGPRTVLFGTDFVNNKSLIKNSKETVPLELDFTIAPDFPTLSSLKSKVRTALVFS